MTNVSKIDLDKFSRFFPVKHILTFHANRLKRGSNLHETSNVVSWRNRKNVSKYGTCMLKIIHRAIAHCLDVCKKSVHYENTPIQIY